MRKSSTKSKLSSNPARVSMLLGSDDEGSTRSEPRKSQIPKPGRLSQDNPKTRIRSLSSDRLSVRPSNLKPPSKTPLRQQKQIRVSTLSTPLGSTLRSVASSLPSGNREAARGRSPSAERASGFHPKGPRKDTRPLSDKSYQSAMLTKVDQFFALINQTSMLNSNGSLRPTTLKMFVDATSLILSLLNVKHNITITNYIEAIPKVAKKLHYPGTITSSWLKTANTMHSWPHVLGWLSWLVEVCEIRDLAHNAFEVAKLPFVGANNEQDKMRNSFLTMLKMYEAWNDERHEEEAAALEEYIQQNNDQYGDVTEATLQELQRDLEKETNSLAPMLEQKNAIDKEVESLQKIFKSLQQEESDDSNYVNSQEAYIKRVEKERKQIAVKTQEYQEEILKHEKMQNELRVVIANQQMTVQQRDALVGEYNNIKNWITLYDNHMKEIENEIYAIDLKLSGANNNLYSTIFRYNKDIILEVMDPSRAVGVDVEDLKIPETHILTADYLVTLQQKVDAVTNLKEEIAKQVNDSKLAIEVATKELIKLRSKLEDLRHKKIDYVEKINEEKRCIEELQNQWKIAETKIATENKKIEDDIVRLKQTMPDLEALDNEVIEAEEKLQAVERKNRFYEEKAEKFFDKFFKTLANHKKEVADIVNKFEQERK